MHFQNKNYIWTVRFETPFLFTKLHFRKPKKKTCIKMLAINYHRLKILFRLVTYSLMEWRLWQPENWRKSMFQDFCAWLYRCIVTSITRDFFCENFDFFSHHKDEKRPTRTKNAFSSTTITKYFHVVGGTRVDRTLVVLSVGTRSLELHGTSQYHEVDKSAVDIITLYILIYNIILMFSSTQFFFSFL